MGNSVRSGVFSFSVKKILIEILVLVSFVCNYVLEIDFTLCKEV